jgi:predicted DNA-binding protein with PD1-like motif
MECVSLGSDIFVRLDPGERLVESLTAVANQQAFAAAAIVSGVGMLSSAHMGFFEVELDDYVTTAFEGIFDLSVVMGNIVRRDGVPVPHVHAVFNDTRHNTISGHIIEITCHITMEIFMSTAPFSLKRVKVPNCPATRILGGS